MLVILVYFCLASCVEQTISEMPKEANWVDAVNVCNGTLLSVNETLVNKQQTGTKIWQPLVKIKTKPMITRGCHSSSSIQQTARHMSMEKNNITNCYHFCYINTPASTTQALLMRKNMCICASKAPLTSYDTAEKCTEHCPGNVYEWCGGNDAYSVYEIENVSDHNHSEGCGYVKRFDAMISYENCTAERGAICTGLNKTEGSKFKCDRKTWDEHNQKCRGHLFFSNDTTDVQWSCNSLLPSGRFWIGRRVWSYVLSGSGHAVLPNVSVECALYDVTTGGIEFSSCWEDHTYVCQKAPSQIVLTVGITVAVVALLVIVCILVILYKKRPCHSVKHVRDRRNSGTDGVPVRQSETPDNDSIYDQLDENPTTLQKDKADYVYDVGGTRAAGININGDDVYDTSNQCSDSSYYYY